MNDPVVALHKFGENAAVNILSDKLISPPSTWGRSELSEWEGWADHFSGSGAWEAATIAWTALIKGLCGKCEAEVRAYYFNDFGAFLLDLGDERAIDCFVRALRLTKSPGRRMRTLGRLGDAAVLIKRDHDRARRFYRAAIAVGDQAGYNPLHIHQAKFRLQEVEADRRGEHREFIELREKAHRDAKKLDGLLKRLEIPAL